MRIIPLHCRVAHHPPDRAAPSLAQARSRSHRTGRRTGPRPRRAVGLRHGRVKVLLEQRSVLLERVPGVGLKALGKERQLRVRVLLHDIVPFLSPVLRKAAWISSVDLARYVILHRYGGLYVDMDIETFRSFEPLCENASLLLTYKPADPSIMASEPNHPFWMWMFERVQRCTKPSDVYRLTGPPGLQEAVEQYLRGATPGAPTIQRFN